MKKQKINTINDLLDFIDKYYDTNLGVVSKVVSKYFDVIIFHWQNETKEDFMNKVKEFYRQLQDIPPHYERPIFLSTEITETFDIKTIGYTERN